MYYVHAHTVPYSNDEIGAWAYKHTQQYTFISFLYIQISSISSIPYSVDQQNDDPLFSFLFSFLFSSLPTWPAIFCTSCIFCWLASLAGYLESSSSIRKRRCWGRRWRRKLKNTTALRHISLHGRATTIRMYLCMYTVCMTMTFWFFYDEHYYYWLWYRYFTRILYPNILILQYSNIFPSSLSFFSPRKASTIMAAPASLGQRGWEDLAWHRITSHSIALHPQFHLLHLIAGQETMRSAVWSLENMTLQRCTYTPYTCKHCHDWCRCRCRISTTSQLGFCPFASECSVIIHNTYSVHRFATEDPRSQLAPWVYGAPTMIIGLTN